MLYQQRGSQERSTIWVEEVQKQVTGGGKALAKGTEDLLQKASRVGISIKSTDKSPEAQNAFKHAESFVTKQIAGKGSSVKVTSIRPVGATGINSTLSFSYLDKTGTKRRDNIGIRTNTLY